MESTTLPTGDVARRIKEREEEEEPIDQEVYNQDPSYSVAMHDLISISTLVDESTPPVARDFSNPTSLVTSLNSSREGSPPDRNGAVIFPEKPLETKFIFPVATAQLPFFASWSNM